MRSRGLTPVRLSGTVLVGLGVVAVDQLSKSLAQNQLAAGTEHVLGPLDLSLTYNSGAAFSLGQGLSPYLVVVVVLIVLGLVVWSTSLRSRVQLLASGLILGGALSNLGDRLLRANHGAVIDWIHLSHWPTFNLADASVVLGVALLVGSMVSSGRHQPGAGR